MKKKDDVCHLIATPEKALCDKLYLSPLQQNTEELAQFLELDLRFDMALLRSFDRQTIKALAKAAGSRNLYYLLQMVG